MSKLRFALVCALLSVVLLAARLRTGALLVALCGLVALVVGPSSAARVCGAAPVRAWLEEGYSSLAEEEKQKSRGSPGTPPMPMMRPYPPPIPRPRGGTVPPPPDHDRVVADHVGGGCGWRPRRPPLCAAVAAPCGSGAAVAPPATDECGHYVGDHTGHPSRRAPNAQASAARCRDRLTRIVPVRSDYRDTTGQMSRFAHLR